MNTAMVDALNGQIGMEFESAFLYLAFSVELSEYGLPGAAHWMLKQYHEECSHALHLLDYLQKRGAHVSLPSISRPQFQWKNPVDLFRLALAHERHVTDSIHALVGLCQECRDYATESILFEYVREQVEEETSVGDIVKHLALCGGSADALLSLDRHLAQR